MLQNSQIHVCLTFIAYLYSHFHGVMETTVSSIIPTQMLYQKAMKRSTDSFQEDVNCHLL